MKTKALIVLFSITMAQVALGKEEQVEDRSLYNRIYFGQCHFKFDPDNPALDNAQWPAMCIKPRISTATLFRENDTGNKNTLNFGEIYAAAHINQYFSMHGEWQKYRLYSLDVKGGAETYADTTKTTKAFIQIGNPATSKVRLAAGKMPIPFGLNHMVLPEIYDQAIKQKKYWQSPDWVARFTVDNQVSSQYDIAYATNEVSNYDREDKIKRPDVRALSARMMFDISGMAGFRFIFSGYGEDNGQRRMGFGFFTKSENGDSTGFEWVRLLTTPDGKQDPFEQNFRLNYRGFDQHGVRSIFEYEDDRFGYRIFTIGADIEFLKFGKLRTGISYLDTIDVNEKNFFMFSVGAEASL